MRVLRPLVILCALVLIWQAVVWLTAAPHFILPGPLRVGTALVERWPFLWGHALVTASEIVLGLLLGTLLGCLTALTLIAVPPARRWLMPVLVVSQAIPVFALAPVLVLWLGYGLASKVAMATLIIYFPVTAAFFDGLRRTEPGWLDLARSLGGRPALVLWRLRVPAALPALGSGVRIAAAVAPIGAVVGEWVGSSAGLGYLMLQSVGRGKTDLMFAALLLLAVFAVLLYELVDWSLKRAIYWQRETAGA